MNKSSEAEEGDTGDDYSSIDFTFMEVCIDINIEDDLDDGIIMMKNDSFIKAFSRNILKSLNGFVYFLFTFLLFPVVI